MYISDDNTDAGGDGIPDNLANMKAKIIIGNEQTNMALYTVPAGHKGYLTDWYASLLRLTGASAVAGDFDVFLRNVDSVFRSTHPIGLNTTGVGERTYKWPYPLELEPKTDIEVRVQPTANSDVAAGFTVLLIN